MNTPQPASTPTDAEKLAAFRSALQQARDSIAQLMAENAALKQRPSAALVGMACRFPGGAESPDAFWTLLTEGRDGIREVPDTRWPGEAFYSADKDAPGKMYTKRAGFLHSDVAAFDAAFFGISPKEARALDPQQRLLLEVTWHALEDARVVPSTLKGSRTGVFVGLSGDDYARLHRHSGAPETIDAFSITGTTMSTAAGRLAYTLGLHGPCLALDTACSSSLVALHLALRSLRDGECDMALVAGVNLILLPELHVAFSKLQALSPDGACRTFDASANGYVRSEGCAVIVLRREADAMARGDRIHALIRGCAINQDGKTSGLAAPNGRAQRAVIKAALQDAGLSPADVDYVEAHGTGTNLGDPIEVEALGEVMGMNRQTPLKIGSVKSNIGHMEPVAGLGGLIKLALCLKHGSIPPNLHFKQPNPHIDWASLPVEVVDRVTPWPASARPRHAGLSAFGFSGTNAHVIVSEPPGQQNAAGAGATDRPVHLLRLSARTPTSLQGLAQAYADCLASRPAALADVCFSAHATRETFDEQLVVFAADAESMVTSLRALAKGELPANARRFTRRDSVDVAWLFTGQGSQYGGMGKALYETAPVFRDAIDACEAVLAGALGAPLTALLFDESSSTIHQTGVTQPALFALEYALAQLWLSWGIRPTALAGHSVGEYAAACVAGVLTLPDALKLISARGQLMQALPADGAMAAVFADEATVRQFIATLASNDRLDVAAVNHPAETVVSGAIDTLDRLLLALTEHGIEHKRLTVSHAFHSPLMEPMLEAFERVASTIAFSRPRITLLSNLTGKPVGEEILTPAYWCDHVRRAVRFSDTVTHLADAGFAAFLEVGPHPVLAASVKPILADRPAITVAASLRKGRDAWLSLAEGLANLMSVGAVLDTSAWDASGRRTIVDLPAYVFDQQRFWHDEGWTVALKQAGLEIPQKSLLHGITWQPWQVPTTPKANPGRWLVVGAGHEPLTAGLLEAGVDVCPIASLPTAELPEQLMAPTLAGVVVLPSVQSPAQLSASLSSLTRLAEQIPATPIWIVGDPQQTRDWSAYRGLIKSLGLEHGWSSGGAIECRADHARVAVRVLLSGTQEDWVRIDDDQCGVARLLPLTVTAAAWQPNPNATYLITGGLGGLGLAMARALGERGATSLLLTGRRSPNEAQASVIEQLRAQGIVIDTLACDVGNPADVMRLREQWSTLAKPLKGVFHLAGVMPISQMGGVDEAVIAATLSGKLSGAWALHEATKDMALEAFVLFGSVSALTGTPGIGAYTAANAALTDVMQLRRQLRLPALCVHWGPWAQGGMMDEGAHRQTRQSGFMPLPETTGFACLWQLLGAGVSEASVIDADWPRVADLFGMRRAQPLLLRLTGDPAHSPPLTVAPTRATPAIGALLALPAAQQVEHLRDSLGSLLASILSLPLGQRPDPGRGFFDLGMESLTALEFREGIQKLTGVKIDAPIVFDYPTLETLTDYLLGEIRPAAAPSQTTASFQEQTPAVDASTLSDEEIARLIEDEFASLNSNGDRP